MSLSGVAQKLLPFHHTVRRQSSVELLTWRKQIYHCASPFFHHEWCQRDRFPTNMCNRHHGHLYTSIQGSCATVRAPYQSGKGHYCCHHRYRLANLRNLQYFASTCIISSLYAHITLYHLHLFLCKTTNCIKFLCCDHNPLY